MFDVQPRFMKKTILIASVFMICYLAACKQSTNNQNTYTAMQKSLSEKNIKEEKTSFQFNGKEHIAYLAYDTQQNGERPGIIVVPEWWGLNEYVRERAKMLADLGYVALAVDVFGNGDTAVNPQEAMNLTKPYNDDPSLSKKVVDVAIEKLKSFPMTDKNKIAVIGYCFGGYVAINAGILGADVKGVVGFHPSLGVAEPMKDSVKAKFLICHGSDDDFEKDNVKPFKQKMDSAGIDYKFIDYPNAKHAFTNPNATEKGEQFNIPVAYNEAADSKSWQDMKDFLKKIFE